MNTPRATWPAPSHKIMKKAHMAQIQESSDPDDTDLGDEDRDIEVEREGMKYGKKHSFHTVKKGNSDYFEDSECETICDMPSEPCMHGMKHAQHKKVFFKEKAPAFPKMPERVVLAHAYVPWHCYEKAFTPEEALHKGTLFPELWGVYPIPK